MTTTHDGHCLQLARAVVAHGKDLHRIHPDRSVDWAHQIFQNSTVTALLDGLFDGGVTYAGLQLHEKFGLGTFNALDAEMVAVDGEIFHLHVDGSVDLVRPEQRTPFAAVRVDGRFEHIITRTVARQVLPYRPLAEATGEQEMNEWTDISGTVVGFHSADYA